MTHHTLDTVFAYNKTMLSDMDDIAFDSSTHYFESDSFFILIPGSANCPAPLLFVYFSFYHSQYYVDEKEQLTPAAPFCCTIFLIRYLLSSVS